MIAQKMRETEVSRTLTRHSRNASDYDLHEMAGGLPLLTLAAPNVHRTS